jgi:hypothetical protein
VPEEAFQDVVMGPADCTISPSDIDTHEHFYQAFDHLESAVAARLIVMYFQNLGSWGPFTKMELCEFFRYRDFHFHRLTHIRSDHKVPEYLVEINDKLYVTKKFVKQCYESSKKKSPRARFGK